jgi:hypothetical protein
MNDEDQPYNRRPSSPPEAASSANGDSTQAQRIWQRYGDAPGIIPTAATLSLYRRIHVGHTARRGLLADFYRRWTPPSNLFSARLPGLVYIWPSAAPGVPFEAGLREPGMRQSRVVPTPPLKRADLGTTLLEPSAPSATGRASAAALLQERGRPRPVVQASARHPDVMQHVVGAARSLSAASVAQLASDTSADQGGAILRRHLSGSFGAAMPRQAVPHSAARNVDRMPIDLLQAGSPISRSEAAPLARPRPDEAQPGRESRPLRPTAYTRRDLGTMLFRQHLGGTFGRALQPWVAILGSVPPAGPGGVVPLQRDARSLPGAPVASGELTSATRSITSGAQRGGVHPSPIDTDRDQVTPVPHVLISPTSANDPAFAGVGLWPSRTGPALDRSPSLPAASRQSAANYWTAPGAAQSSPSPRLMTSPLPAVLIQRQYIDQPGPLPLPPAGAVGMHVARQSAPPTGAGPETSGPESSGIGVSAAVRASAEAGVIDVEQLTEQVSRLIWQRLAVERERRGMGRWH